MIQITSDGFATGTSITDDDGREIGHLCAAIDWSVRADGVDADDDVATATVRLDLHRIQAVAGDVDWRGLELVPTEALEQELARREAE